jgi:hypothetical protein
MQRGGSAGEPVPGDVSSLLRAGLSVEETAEVLHVSPITVMREWKTAKAWLYRELTGGSVNGSRALESRR